MDDLLPPYLVDYVRNEIKTLSENGLYEKLYRFKLYNILIKSPVEFDNFVKLLHLPDNVLDDVLSLNVIKFSTIRDMISLDEYRYDDDRSFPKYINTIKNRKEDVKQNYSTMYRCPKCKERKSTIMQKQTRSADEMPTIIVTCVCCGHHYRV